MLACHYDSKNITDGKGNYLIAATDSAVPCAILMDVAKKLDCALRMDRKSVSEPSHEKRDLSTMRVTHMCSHSTKSLPLVPYIMCANSKGSGETAQMPL